MKRGLLAAGISILAIAAIACGSDAEPTTAAAPTAVQGAGRMLQPGDAAARPTGALDTSKTYTATVKTEKGDIVVTLLDDIAPIYVENFVNLSRIGYYDDTTFHRVINDFMAQGGDPTGTGGGGPGYRFDDQFHPEMRHDRAGVLSMANAGLNTNGSQFFITHRATPHLDPFNADGSAKACASFGVSCHAVFGRVTEGLDVLLDIRVRDPGVDPDPGDRIVTIEITES
jgi:cyclophilin family peptidyl-prolyl cis-trans isomerase